MILLIDNYDSFTYNLYQYIAIFYSDIKLVRNDKITLEEIEKMRPEALVISPGPKSPKEAGICVEAIKRFAKEVPILGICLGHQAIAEAFGGKVTFAKKLMHGKASLINHNEADLFRGIKSPSKVARYHSLAVLEEGLPKELEVLARDDGGEIMAIKHKDYCCYGLQFHPESIFTDYGKKMIENFLEEAKIL